MFDFRTLGSVHLQADSGEEVAAVLAAPKLVALLAYLAVATPRGLHRRDSVVGLLWPELTQDRARAALRHSVYRLRALLGANAIVSRGDEDVGLDSSVVRCDAARFEELLDAGSLAEALALYRGDLMPGFFLRGVPEYERWLDMERTRLRLRASESACRLAEELVIAGRGDEAARRARESLAIAPDDEQLLRRVMGILAGIGDTAGALREYDSFARRLREEYESSPSRETRALAERCREPDGGAVPAGAQQTTGGLPAGFSAVPRATGLPSEAAAPASAAPASAIFDQPASNRRTIVRTAAVITAAAILAAGVYGVNRPTADAASEQPTIAVLPFDVRGARDLEYLREGLSDLLSIGVDGAAGLRTADPRAVMAQVRALGDGPIEAADAKRIARQVGAGLYVTGSVVEAGGQITLIASLRDANGRVRSSAQTPAADKGRLFELVDDLARRLLAGADRSAPERAGLAARTTRSMAALRSYLEGERELRAGRHVAAVDAFRQAVAEDSTFALAWYRLSSAGRWTTDYRLAEEASDKAVLYKSALPPYARRLVDAASAMRLGDYSRSESLYVAGTRSRPSDTEAWFGLGDLHYHYNALLGRSRLEARRSFERSLALDAGDGESRVHLLELAAWEGNVREVDSLLTGLPPGSDFGEKWPIIRALITGDRPAEATAIAAMQQGDERATVMMVIHSTSAFPSNLPGAARVTGLLTDPARSPARRAYGFSLRAQVELARGRWDAARKDLVAMGAFEPAAAIEYGAILSLSPGASMSAHDLAALRAALSGWNAAPTPPSASPVFGVHNGFHSQFRLYLLGLVAARMGDTTSATRYADSLATHPGDTLKSLLAANLARAVRARVIARRGNVDAALAELGQPWIDTRTHRSHYSPILAQVADRYFRAELLQRAGRHREALDAYSAVADFSLDGLMYLPMSHLRRGDIYLKTPDRAKATEHYAKAVALLRDCDPELLPLREAAERKIAQLKPR